MRNPTKQQEAIISAAVSGKSIAVSAGPGTGKTSTLEMVAQALHQGGDRILYVCFNKSVQVEAQKKFGQTATAKTINALAFGACVRQHGADSITSRIKPWLITELLGTDKCALPDYISVHDFNSAILGGVSKFCQSADSKMMEEHMHSGHLYHMTRKATSDDECKGWDKHVLAYAKRLWSMMSDPSEYDYPLGFDGSVKIMQQAERSVPYDTIMLDEAQDTNCVTEGWLDTQRQAGKQIIIVGDSKQAIYGWRGGKDIMQSFNCDVTLPLSSSFRFGQQIAYISNLITVAMGREDFVTGLRSDSTDSAQTATICRTNLGVLKLYVSAHIDDKTCAIVGGKKDIEADLGDYISLVSGGSEIVRQSSAFYGVKSGRDLADTAKKYPNSDLGALCKLFGQCDARQVLDKMKNEYHAVCDADVVLSTAHKSKGLEFDTVEFSDCWNFDRSIKTGDGHQILELAEYPAEEIRLLYVAVTRAKHNVILSESLKRLLDR